MLRLTMMFAIGYLCSAIQHEIIRGKYADAIISGVLIIVGSIVVFILGKIKEET